MKLISLAWTPSAPVLVALIPWIVSTPARANDVPEKYRETVRKGLEYLAGKQHKDGHWEGDEGMHPVTMTSLAGSALLLEGGTPFKGKYSANVYKAMRWLMDRSQRHGLIFSGHPSEVSRYMYGHGLAMQFLKWGHEAYRIDGYAGFDDMKERERWHGLLKLLDRAAGYSMRARSTQGGWFSTSTSEGHDLDEVLATVIQIGALDQYQFSGADAARFQGAISDAHQYLNFKLAPEELQAAAKRERKLGLDTPAALARRLQQWSRVAAYSQGNTLGLPASAWFAYCESEISSGERVRLGQDELVHFYYSQALYMSGETPEVVRGTRKWSDYSTALFDHLQKHQRQDGSWPAGDGLSIGPVYSTAVWCTVLQLDTNRHPSAIRPGKTRND